MLVSIVMPASNADVTIGPAIRSIQAQTHDNFELLVCDDGSSDGTGEQTQSARDARIRLYSNETRLGPGRSRDRMLGYARGDWITFCDADDMWEPDRIERMLEATCARAESVVFDDIMLCHHTRQGMQPWRRMRGSHAFGAGNNPVRVPTDKLIDSSRMLMQPFFSRELWRTSGATHSNHAFGEDSVFLLKLLAGGGQLVYVPLPLYLYRVTPGSASGNPERYGMLADALRSSVDDFPDQPDVLAALDRKIKRVESGITYLPFSSAVKQHQFALALRIAVHHPVVVPQFLMRSAREVPYQIHRLAHGGSTRKLRQKI